MFQWEDPCEFVETKQKRTNVVSRYNNCQNVRAKWRKQMMTHNFGIFRLNDDSINS